MKYLPLATGAGLLLGGTLLFSLQDSSPIEDQTSTDVHAEAPTGSQRSAPKAPPRASNHSRSPRSENQGGTGAEMDIVLDESESATGLTPIQLQSLTHRLPLVRQSALAKLETMSERHNLTPAQREKLFPLLVESTAGYHPAMKVRALRGGSWVPAETSGDRTVDEAIHEVLDPEQNEAFVEEQIDERAWWDEIVAQLEEDFEGSASVDPPGAGPSAPNSTPESGAPTPTQPTSTPAQQGGNIFDLLKK